MNHDSYVLRNRRVWDRAAPDYADAGRRSWASEDAVWGIWRIPEPQVGLFPPLAGRRVLELGCGTGYVSAWMARRGARPVGLNDSASQLATARRFQGEFDLEFPLLQADAERVPLADASFDVVISEYGASIWCDPYRWIPEASRLLTPGGDLVFLVRPYLGMHRFDWPGEESVDFHLGHGDPSEALPESLRGPWPSEREFIRLLGTTGFEIVDLLELRPPDGSTTPFKFVTLGWAQRWPSEEVWKARKRTSRTAGEEP